MEPNQPKETEEPRFWVALSFAGEHRKAFVRDLANALAERMPREKIFFDEWYEAELLGANGDLKLTGMYKTARLIIPHFSEHYEKPWCNLEWRTIRGILLNRAKDDAVIPIRLDDTPIPGWPEVGFEIRPKGRGPEDIANLIKEALDLRLERDGQLQAGRTNVEPPLDSLSSSSSLSDMIRELIQEELPKIVREQLQTEVGAAIKKLGELR